MGWSSDVLHTKLSKRLAPGQVCLDIDECRAGQDGKPRAQCCSASSDWDLIRAPAPNRAVMEGRFDDIGGGKLGAP